MLVDTKAIILETLPVVRGFAHRVLVTRETLPPRDDDALARAMREYMAAGEHLRLTQAEMVRQGLRGLFAPMERCECSQCRWARGEGGRDGP